MTPGERERVVDALALSALKLAVGAWVLHAGFSHVSDDDYARTVIAEQFAHAPRLDPSGTSWLPAPFWVEGAAMMAFGRTLGVARAVAIVLGAASVAAPYLAMRAAGMARAAALGATAVAMTLPWNAWLGVATVPEAWAGALLAAGALSWAVPAARPWAAAALLVASLSRYEAWPACAVAAGASAVWAVRGGATRRQLGLAAMALAGPVGWMAWNAHAHGSPLHFVDRVTAFRLATGAAAVPGLDKGLGVPRDLVTEAPVAAALGFVGLALLRTADGRARWTVAATTCLAIVAFLVVGEVRDGAPTHHPARALVAVWWILIAMGADAASRLHAALASRSAVQLAATAGGAVLGVALAAWTLAAWARFPGASADEDRAPQIRRGLDLRARGVAAADVAPCSFEHFALLAAWGAPERASVAARSGEPPGAECPGVVERGNGSP